MSSSKRFADEQPPPFHPFPRLGRFRPRQNRWIPDPSTAAFNSNLTGGFESIDVDLGSAFTIDGFGLAEQDYGGAGGRALVQNARLEFSDDPAFSTINATRDVELANIGYQQLDFDPATGRYVRFSVQSQHPGNDANLGFTEIQLFQAVPEPGVLAIAVTGLPLLLRRRRRSAAEAAY